jgi:Fe-Mn family superoxide dismutase
MLRVYGPLMPLRILEEIRFWKMQEKEHTLVIRAIAPELEHEYIRLMEEWERVFVQTEMTAAQWIEFVIRSKIPPDDKVHSRIQELSAGSMQQSQQFIRQLLLLQEQSASIRNNTFVKTVIQHIIRESEYFLGVLHGIRPETSAGSSGHPSNNHHAAHARDTQEKAKLHIASRPEVDRGIELTSTQEGLWSPPEIRHDAVSVGGHKLPPLPYAYDALEPYIDAETMRLHHDKHHKAYVDGLNLAENMLAKARETGEYALIKHWERELAFNGAGHYLHTLFWNVMKPKGGGKATGPIAAALVAAFGSFDAFQRQFTEAADKVEGGGWAVLVWSPRSRRLEILQAEKHQNLSQWDAVPLLPLDVWEHAYYLKYKNERRKYIDAWWNVVNWSHVNERFTAARKLKWSAY